MRKFLLGLAAVLAVTAPIALAATPASAATSNAPTISAADVARGKTIKVKVNARGSTILRRTDTLWKAGHRVHDWSPTPGLYKVRSTIRYRTKTTTRTKYWVPDEYCYGDYDENGNWDDSLGCEDYGHWDWKTTTKLSPTKKVTRYDYARVHSDETPGCVSTSEFRAAKDGMTQAQVHGIFGTTGWVEYSGSGGVGREYRTCTGDPDWSYVSVDFDPRVWFKWQYISW